MIRTIIIILVSLGAWLVLTSFDQLRDFLNSSRTNTAAVTKTDAIEIKNAEQTSIVESEQIEDVATDEETVATDAPETEIQVEASNHEAIPVADKGAAESSTSQQNSSSSAITGSNSIDTAGQTTATISPAYNPWATGNYPGMFNPMANTPYMNMMSMNMMNPMFSMMAPMMGMMNPAMYMNPMTMMQHPINTMTQPQAMDSMMRSMDPSLMFSMFGHPGVGYYAGQVPDQLPVVTIPGFPTQTYQNWPKNKMSPGVSREAKKNAFQMAMAVSPLSMRDMISIMADKTPLAEDVSWDDAVEAMKLRANEVNFKFVGSSPLWKEIEAITEQPSAKVEIFRFCDAAVAREILDEVPEFIVFLPCRIALIEDGEGKLWVMTLDWDVKWLDFAQNPNSHLSKHLREGATRIRESIAYIMEGAATGGF